MNENKKMDDNLVGPRLFCEVCSESKVLSPCYFCKFNNELDKEYCRGCGGEYCGSDKYCDDDNEHCQEYEICGILGKERLLLEINEIAVKKEVEAHFFDYRVKELPPEIGLLTNLKILSLDNNQLRELPAEIGLLTKLQELYLCNNQLRELPAEIGLLTKLQKLYLSNNQLRELPKEIAQFTKMRYLDLSNNQLRELPTEILELTKLKELHLRDNQLSEISTQKLKKTLPKTKIFLGTSGFYIQRKN